MSLRINLNTASLTAQRNLTGADSALGKSIERLSSGYKINSAGDDPAGLVISEKLRAQIGGLNMAIKNAGDAVNMVKTAEGALQEVHTLLRSMRDLAVHASNAGANDASVAAADQTQITNALASLDKIADETQFGDKKLLDGTAGLKALITGTTVTGASFANATTLAATDVIDLNVTQAASRATFTSSVDISGGMGAAGSFYLNGVKVDYASGDDMTDIVGHINALTDQTGVTASVSGNNVKMDSIAYGSTAHVNLVGMAVGFNAAANDANDGLDAEATVAINGGGNVSDVSWDKGVGNQLKDSLGNTIDLVAGTSGAQAGQFQIAGAALEFQIGAFAGQTRSLSLSDTHASQLGTGVYAGEDLSKIDVKTTDGAQHAIKILDKAISDISTIRSNLGATQKNVFESSINSLTIAKENISASESSIRDTDMAAEMANFTKLQIMNQVGTAMLSQANQSAQNLLSLIR